jgi:NAD(P)H-hydrate epimerase
MKFFTTKQIAEIDRYTIENEPIKSIDLMERAAERLFNSLYFNYLINEYLQKIVIFAGPGNNGGDGLALARYLSDLKVFKITVYLVADKEKLSPDCSKNLKRLKKIKDVKIKVTLDVDEIKIPENCIIIDALFGSGLNRPLGEPYKSIIRKINSSGNKVFSIDMPSGLIGEDNRSNDHEAIVQADVVLTLEFPKLAFFFKENSKYVKSFKIVDIDLHEEAKQKIYSPYYYVDEEFISPLIRKRERFAEKRDFGHALLVAGSYEKPGSAIIAAKSCLKSGVGLLNIHIPERCYEAIIVSLPEAMLSIDKNSKYTSSVSIEKYYTAVGIGPGIGLNKETQNAFYNLLLDVKKYNLPLVIDADGLNILAENNEWLNLLPENTILTPHFREFDRLFGKHETHYERFLTAQEIAKKYKIIVVLKGAYTQIHCPDGNVYFNSSGTPALAKAGSGDVLTGMILSFLAQKYQPHIAAILAVYIHGKAGMKAEELNATETILATDVIEQLDIVFNEIKDSKI